MISLKNIAMGIKTNFRDSFWSEVDNKCQNLSGHAVPQLLLSLSLNLYGYLIWEQGQKMYYIQPSNLSSALLSN